MNRLPWKARLASMDHSKGTSNKMIQTAMLAEIKDLRCVERECRAKLDSMRRGVERYERRSEALIAQLEKQIRNLKGRP